MRRADGQREPWAVGNGGPAVPLHRWTPRPDDNERLQLAREGAKDSGVRTVSRRPWSFPVPLATRIASHTW